MMNSTAKKVGLIPVMSFMLTVFLLSIVHCKVSMTMLLAERYLIYSGWAEIVVLGLYAALVTYQMQNPDKVSQWRKYTWMVFSFVFFGQLFLGLTGVENMLMTGDLHLPIPAVILCGPIYRGELSFMPILFLVTILLSGPAWCSHLCYFGGLDNVAAGRTDESQRTRRTPNLFTIKFLGIGLIIISTILLRIFYVDILTVVYIAVAFGIAGLGCILLLSIKRKKMFHCIAYCPIGTIVAFLKYVSPFRMKIALTCDSCNKCSKYCKYEALGSVNIKKKKPGHTCTYCGDCLTSCPSHSIHYRFLNLSPRAARNLYLIVTISLHACFLGLARI